MQTPDTPKQAGRSYSFGIVGGCYSELIPCSNWTPAAAQRTGPAAPRPQPIARRPPEPRSRSAKLDAARRRAWLYRTRPTLQGLRRSGVPPDFPRGPQARRRSEARAPGTWSLPTHPCAPPDARSRPAAGSPGRGGVSGSACARTGQGSGRALFFHQRPAAALCVWRAPRRAPPGLQAPRLLQARDAERRARGGAEGRGQRRRGLNQARGRTQGRGRRGEAVEWAGQRRRGYPPLQGQNRGLGRRGWGQQRRGHLKGVGGAWSVLSGWGLVGGSGVVGPLRKYDG